jgi:hypothetical protein
MCKCEDIFLKKKKRNCVRDGLGIKMLMHIIGFWMLITFMNLCIGGESLAHLVQSNKPMYK